MKKSIVNIMLASGLGGIEQAAIDYAEATRLAGHKSYLIMDNKAKIAEKAKALSLDYFTIKHYGKWDVLASWKIRKLVRKLEADVVITHGNRALSLSRWIGKIAKFTVAHNYKIKTGGITALICPTRDLQLHYQKKGLPEIKLPLLPNMVRVNQPFIQREAHNPIVIGAMGRLVAKKGFEWLIKSLSLLQQRGVDFKAIIGGEGEEKSRLQALISKEKLESRIELIGWVKDSEDFYDRIDIFCLPSLHEPFGIVLLEAMAHSVPVIASDSEGPGEILEQGVSGMIFPKQEVNALADALQDVINNPEKRKFLAEHGYNRVKTTYDLPLFANRLNALLTNAKM